MNSPEVFAERDLGHIELSKLNPISIIKGYLRNRREVIENRRQGILFLLPNKKTLAADACRLPERVHERAYGPGDSDEINEAKRRVIRSHFASILDPTAREDDDMWGILARLENDIRERVIPQKDPVRLRILCDMLEEVLPSQFDGENYPTWLEHINALQKENQRINNPAV